jgi:dihydropteroate synthase
LTDLTRTLVMGVVNVTPDSFSDGGDFLDADAAVAHGLALVADGADLVDIGGESTRPGAARVDAAEELRRVLPVVRTLAAEGVVVSIDTMRASVAAATLEAGAALVNDVSGGQADEGIGSRRADAGTAVRRHALAWAQLRTLASGPCTAVVVTEVVDELRGRLMLCRPRVVDL